MRLRLLLSLWKPRRAVNVTPAARLVPVDTQKPPAARRLIINADDFGLTQGVNRAIFELNAAAVLPSATLMATGGAFRDAVHGAFQQTTLGVGCHVVLLDGDPVLHPDDLPTLAPSGRLRSSLNTFVRDLFAGRIRAEEIEREAGAQIRKIQSAGLTVTHVDTHKHAHMFPRALEPLLRAARAGGIAAIRNPFEPSFSRDLAHAGLKRRAQISLLNRFRPSFHRHTRDLHALTTGGTVGVSATGNLNAATLTQILNALPTEGAYELVCHPGYNDHDLDRVATRLRRHREIEMQALRAVIPQALAKPNAPTRVHFGALAPSAALEPQR